MLCQALRIRVCPLAVVAFTAAGLWSSAMADAAQRCRSADLRYPFEPGGPKTIRFDYVVPNG